MLAHFAAPALIRSCSNYILLPASNRISSIFKPGPHREVKPKDMAAKQAAFAITTFASTLLAQSVNYRFRDTWILPERTLTALAISAVSIIGTNISLTVSTAHKEVNLIDAAIATSAAFIPVLLALDTQAVGINLATPILFAAAQALTYPATETWKEKSVNKRQIGLVAGISALSAVSGLLVSRFSDQAPLQAAAMVATGAGLIGIRPKKDNLSPLKFAAATIATVALAANALVWKSIFAENPLPENWL